MEWFRIKEAEEMLGLSHTSIHKRLRKHFNELRDHFKKENGVTTLSKHAIEFLKQTVQKAENIKATDLKRDEKLSETLQAHAAILERQLKEKDDVIRELINNQAAERQRADTIIMNMSNQVKSQMMLLEDMRKDLDEVKQMKVEKAEPAKPVRSEAKEASTAVSSLKKSEKKMPRAKKTFGALYRMFLETFYPWKLREDSEEEKEAA